MEYYLGILLGFCIGLLLKSTRQEYLECKNYELRQIIKSKKEYRDNTMFIGMEHSKLYFPSGVITIEEGQYQIKGLNWMVDKTVIKHKNLKKAVKIWNKRYPANSIYISKANCSEIALLIASILGNLKNKEQCNDK